MARNTSILLCVVLSLTSLAVWKWNESAVAMATSILLLAAALAQFYSADFPRGLYRIGISSLDNLGLLVIGCLTAYLLLGGVDAALRPPTISPQNPGRSAAAAMEWALLLFVCVVPPWPLILGMIRQRDRSGLRALFWPTLAGFGGGGSVWLACEFLWITLARPALEGSGSIDNTLLNAMFALSEAGLVAGVGGSCWLRAIDPRAAESFDNTGMFAEVVATTVASLSLGVLLALFAAIRGLDARLPLSVNGGVWCGVLLSLLGTAWIIALLRVSRPEPIRSISALAVLVLLMILFAVGFAVPMFLVGAREWTPLVLLVVAPLTLLATGLVLAAIPPAISAMLRR